ncbi:MAG: hypothetical protein ABSG25_15325 [Bryobacteraceae bacterium]
MSLRLFGLALFLAATGMCSDSAKLDCSVQLPAYDEIGNRIQLKITSVARDGMIHPNLLTTTGDFHMMVHGQSLDFSSAALRHRIDVTYITPDGKKLTTRLVLMACHQRASLEYGNLDSEADVIGSTITGRITGCKLNGDWWIRAMPMFGQCTEGLVEGYIRQADGMFQLDGNMWGDRHIIVIGKGKEPVKAFAVNVTVGGLHNDVGTIDLSGSCPP